VLFKSIPSLIVASFNTNKPVSLSYDSTIAVNLFIAFTTLTHATVLPLIYERSGAIENSALGFSIFLSSSSLTLYAAFVTDKNLSPDTPVGPVWPVGPV
jgi:hypothetical protein